VQFSIRDALGTGYRLILVSGDVGSFWVPGPLCLSGRRADFASDAWVSWDLKSLRPLGRGWSIEKSGSRGGLVEVVRYEKVLAGTREGVFEPQPVRRERLPLTLELPEPHPVLVDARELLRALNGLPVALGIWRVTLTID
jgi:hypothetical protein